MEDALKVVSPDFGLLFGDSDVNSYATLHMDRSKSPADSHNSDTDPTSSFSDSWTYLHTPGTSTPPPPPEPADLVTGNGSDNEHERVPQFFRNELIDEGGENVARAPSVVNKSRMTVTWLGQSTCFVQLEGLNILTDPIFG